MRIKLLMVFLVCTFNNVYAQQGSISDDLSHQIFALDNNLYVETVACNKSALESFYDKNVEIYDGKNGLLSLTDLYNSKYFETCDTYKVEPTLESLAVYPLNNFGAILTGVIADRFGLVAPVLAIGLLTIFSSIIIQYRMSCQDNGIDEDKSIVTQIL